ncbi:MAG: DUF459 domain-containing protein [Acidimicrobiales bacterium]
MPVSTRIPGLDGLRALAVCAVLAFHFGVPGVGGGMLGVDIFFALSGFLITTLLLAERAETGGVSLGRFWQRRARRLLPALILTGTAVLSHWVALVPAAQLRGDLLAAVYYGSNWHYVAAGENYFSQYGAPSPLLHLWSLAVEEQFYLVWPLVAVLVLRRWGRVGVMAVAGAGTVASTVWTLVLYRHGAGVSRLYYGTDTRAQTLLAGATLAAALAGGVPAWVRSAARWAGPAGLAGLLWCLHDVSGSAGFLYQGGFLVVAVAAGAVVAAAALQPGAGLARALSLRPVRYLGRISYGLYLYHWPLFLLLDHARTGLSGPGLLGLRLVATGTTAAVSFHLIEEPIRSGRLGRARGRWRAAGALSAGAVLGSAGLLAVTAGPATASAVTPPTPVTPAQARVATALLAPGPPPSTTRPVRAMLVGDSIGVTLAQGLQVGSLGWGVALDDQAALGCDLDPGTTVNINGAPGPAGQGCPDWASQWAQLVQSQDPDVVAVELGRFETADRLYEGRWVSVGDAVFAAHLQAEVVEAIDILSARGAKVVLMTLPYVDQTTEEPDGSPLPINDPARTRAWNALLGRAAAQRPGVASVLNVNAMLDPGGHYADFIDGIRVRSTDREHISAAGGMLVRHLVLPVLAQVGLAHADARVDG